MRSSGATRARCAIDARSGSSSRSPACGDSAADDDAVRAEEDQHVRDREADQARRRARARRAPRRRRRAPRATASSNGPRRPRARSRARRRRARGSRGCRSRRAGPSSATVWWPNSPARSAGPEVQPAAEHEPAADRRCRRRCTSRSSAPRAGAERRLGERERVPVVDQRDRRAEAALRAVADRARPSSRRGGSAGARATPVLVEEPRQRDADRVDRRRPTRPSSTSRAEHRLRAAVLGARRRLAAARRARPSSSSASLMFVPPRSSPSAPHRAVQPPSTVSTAPVTNGAVAR